MAGSGADTGHARTIPVNPTIIPAITPAITRAGNVATNPQDMGNLGIETITSMPNGQLAATNPPPKEQSIGEVIAALKSEYGC